MTTEQLRPRRNKSRRARRFNAAPQIPKLNRRQAIAAAAAVLVLGGGTGAHFLQLSTVHDLEKAAAVQDLDPSLAGAFHEDPVFNGPEWTALKVMASASEATERLADAGHIEARRDSVWLPWLSGRADDAAGTYLAADGDALFTDEFKSVHAQTKAACASPETGLPVQSFIDSWAPSGHPEVTVSSGPTIPAPYADDVTAAAYRVAMQAGTAYLCPEAVQAEVPSL